MKLACTIAAWLLLMVAAPAVLAQSGGGSGADASGSSGPFQFSINVDGGEGPEDVSVAIQLVAMMTLLTLAPSIIMMMTSFTRIVIVLGFVKQAAGVHGAPSSQIVIGMALFLTFFIMAPTWNSIYQGAVEPLMADEITSQEALETASLELREFMMVHTRPDDVDFFLDMAGKGPTNVEDVPMSVVIPSFILSELRTAFQMGFLIFIPFLIVDFLVASTLMSMGMMMMPPVIVSLPFKLLLFVLVDGWYLVIRSLVQSFTV